MKYLTPLTITLLLAVSTVSAEKILIDTTKFTFPEALDRLKMHMDFTYSLPRIYRHQGAKGHMKYSTPTEPRELFESVIRRYMRAHSLRLKGVKNKHYQFTRTSESEYTDGPTLLEAIARLEHYLKIEGLELEGWSVETAEKKYEYSTDYFGLYWHIKYRRKLPADGGVGTHHFFIYEDLLVEHIEDGNAAPRKRQSTQEIIDSTSSPRY